MSFNLVVPLSGETPLTLALNAGDVVFLLGANGTGNYEGRDRDRGGSEGWALRATRQRSVLGSSDDAVPASGGGVGRK